MAPDEGVACWITNSEWAVYIGVATTKKYQPASAVGSSTKAPSLAHSAASLRRRRRRMSCWMRRTSAIWASSARTSVEGRPIGLTVCGSRIASAPGTVMSAREALSACASTSWPATSSSTVDFWNGSSPDLRKSRTASKSDVAGKPCFCASLRAMRSWRPVRPSRRMPSMSCGPITAAGRVWPSPIPRAVGKGSGPKPSSALSNSISPDAAKTPGADLAGLALRDGVTPG